MNSQAEELHASDYLRPLLRRKWLVLAIVAVATAATYAFYASKDKVYEASTNILISTTGSPLDSTVTELSDRTVQDQAALLKSRDVAREVARRLDRPRDARELAASVTAEAQPGSNFVVIKARRPDPVEAARVANAFARAFVSLRTDAQRSRLDKAIQQTIAQLDRLPRTESNQTERASLAESVRRMRLTKAVSEGSASQVDPAVPPASPVSPHPVRNALLALILSFLGAAALAYALEALDRRPRRVEEFASLYQMPVLAVTPHSNEARFRENGQAALGPGFKEPFRQLRTNLQLAALDRPFKRILVTSAIAGEGKSTVVRNLAIVMREGGARVAVIDSDLRRPMLAEFFNQRAQPGLTDVLTGSRRLGDAVVSVPVHVRGLGTLAQIEAVQAPAATNGGHGDGVISLLPAGPQPADPQAVLAADRTRRLIDEVSADHDVVLIDSPPLLHVTDAIALAPLVDAVIVVARLGHVTRDNARRVTEVLSRIPGARAAGVVVNDVPLAEGAGYGYGYGYGYG